MTSRLLVAAPLVAVVSLLTAACGDPAPASARPDTTSAARTAPTARASAPPSAAPAASAAAPTASRGGMSHCPNAVEGAKVDIQDDPTGVVMTVTATEARATEAIRERARWIDGKAKAEVGTIQHTGEGGGGGVLGRCPVVLKGTTVDLADVDGGTKITMKVADGSQIDWLRREVRERQAKLGDPAAAAAEGHRKMANCPSAADGAATAVVEKGGAVVVTVTAKDPAAIADVQARAKKLAEAAKAAASDKHDGSGGGAGTGRCPIVLEETTIAPKDVANGVEITITPAEAGDVGKVAKEARARADRFTAGSPK